MAIAIPAILIAGLIAAAVVYWAARESISSLGKKARMDCDEGEPFKGTEFAMSTKDRYPELNDGDDCHHYSNKPAANRPI